MTHPFRDPLPDEPATAPRLRRPHKPPPSNRAPLDELLSRLDTIHPEAREACRVTAARWGVSVPELLSHARCGSKARRHFWLWLRANVIYPDGSRISYPRIAWACGIEDHTSVMWGVRKAETEALMTRGIKATVDP